MSDDPIELGEESQEVSDPKLETLMKRFGVNTYEELEERIDNLKLSHKTFAKQRNQIEEMEAELEVLRQKREEEDVGITQATDPAVKRLTRMVTDLQKRVLRSPEDDELEEYLSEARRLHPRLMDIKDPAARLEAYRDVARGLRAEKEMSATQERARQSGERKALSSSRAYVERSGAGFGGSRQPSEEDDLKRFESEYEAADTDAKRKAVSAKYRRMYPDWGL